jgi:hypothetical protein
LVGRVAFQYLFNPAQEPFDFAVSILEPVCRPDAVYLPAEVLQDFLAEPITVAG